MKKQINFSFLTPLIEGVTKPINHGDLLIEGVGYNHDGEYCFDLNNISLDGKDFTSLYRYLAGEEMSRLVDVVHEATIQHLTKLFRGDYAYPGEAENVLSHARKRVENGDISFESLGAFVRAQNTILYPNSKPAA